MTRATPAILLLSAALGGACEPHNPPEAPWSVGILGPISEPLGDAGAQHHATLACAEHGCIVAREAAGTVAFSALAPDGSVTSGWLAPAESHEGWNHPQIRPTADGAVVVAATAGAPQLLALDPWGAVVDGPHALAEPWPWGLWPDLSIGDDGRALVIWSTKTTPWTALIDPANPAPTPQTWELAHDQATVDPPAVAAVPGGHVRAWTVKNGFVWEVRLQWLDLDGVPVGAPVIAAAGVGSSRGARPQLAARPSGEVAVAFRVWPASDLPPEGAFVRAYGPDRAPLGPVHQLDAADRGDRPTLLPTEDGWLAAWEQGEPAAVVLGELSLDGHLLTDPLPVSASEVPAGRTSLARRADGGVWLSWEEVHSKRGDQVLASDVRLRALVPR